MFKRLEQWVTGQAMGPVSSDRKEVLEPLIQYIRKKKEDGEELKLNFICTHNSRRSQLSQLWAQAMAYRFGVSDVSVFSGGMEVTAFHPNAINTLEEIGFEYDTSAGENPVIRVRFADAPVPEVVLFSKLFNDSYNPSDNFAAVMTCDHASENCPVVFGAEQRIPVMYTDPKKYDGTELQHEKYLETSKQIAREMYYVFSNINPS